MIRYLAIRNLAVIESAAVEFEQAFNVLTGETGAGKSILVEAVGLLLGGRASQDLLRTGADVATVEAIFEADGAEIVVRRELTAQGRSRAFINGALATASALKDLSNRLVELHGQHEHQQLLDPDQHLGVLDAWAGLEARVEEAAEAYRSVRTLREALDRLRMDDRERAARLELVEFQLHELEQARLGAPDEDETLAHERQILRSADTIRQLSAEAYAELYDAEQSVLAGLGHVWKRVGELAAIDPAFGPYLDARDAIRAQLDDLAFALRDTAERVDLTPGRLQAVEDRLALVERLKRKHGPTLPDVLARRDALRAERAALTGGSASASELEAQLAERSARYLRVAGALSESRRAAAPRFARALEAELAELAMGRTAFEVRLASDPGTERWGERGYDRGEFYLSPNPGEDLRPLARIVSGGELSRVMLALKTLAAGHQPDRTLIFDEVDAGIGGRVATVVGEKLRRLGERFQVLCITHLPQIAAAGSTHFLIEKAVQGRRTVTSVTRLDDEARVEELARMMGGADAGAQARASARELLGAAKAKAAPGAKAKGESPKGRK
ncbi:MAG: DNA repair protein RecN [Acidobacteriota bacterium]